MLMRWAAQRHLSLDEAAKRVGVPARQLRRWIKEHPELRAAIAAGERTTDAQVIQALYNRATGVDVEDSELWLEQKDGRGRRKKMKKGKRHLPPNIYAIMFWLRNRLPEQWGDRPDAPTPAEIIARIRPAPQLKPRLLPAPEPETSDSPPQT